MILAMDCSHDACSVAVCDNGGVLAAKTVDMARGQAEALIPMVKETMESAGKTFADLTGIAVSTGPGSFTGVRVGLAAANGLAMAADLPEAGVSVTEAEAGTVPWPMRMMSSGACPRADGAKPQLMSTGRPSTAKRSSVAEGWFSASRVSSKGALSFRVSSVRQEPRAFAKA